MTWFGNQKGEGFEYHLLIVGIGIAIITKGGRCSLDRIPRRKDRFEKLVCTGSN
jgi:putative oxidoreductase